MTHSDDNISISPQLYLAPSAEVSVRTINRNLNTIVQYFLPRDAMPSRSVCLTVCPSDTFVYSVETNKRIFNFLSRVSMLTRDIDIVNLSVC